jgi:hypothetical protein
VCGLDMSFYVGRFMTSTFINSSAYTSGNKLLALNAYLANSRDDDDDDVRLIINLIKTNLIRFFLINSVELLWNLKILSMGTAYSFC